MKKDPIKKGKNHRIEIRQMEIDDIAAVFHLGERLFTSQRVPNLYRMWDEFEVTSIFQDDPELCIVAETEEKIVGFAVGTTYTKFRSAWKYGHLIWLGVDPKYHRSRVATRLFRHFRDIVEETGVRMLLIDTDGENEPALKFFARMGFGNPRRHIYMTLNLETNTK